MEYLIIILFLCGIVGSIMIWTFRNKISPMPTSSKVKGCLIKILPKDIDGKIYELGSGWGTLVFPLADNYPDCQVIGYESSPVPYWASRMRAFCKSHKNLRLEQSDFFEKNLSDAGLVVCYLYPGAMSRLKEKFEKELKAGTYVISNTFAVPGWEAEAIYEVRDLYRTRIYLYKF